MLKRLKVPCFSILSVLLALATPAMAQTDETADTPIVEPGASAALDRMNAGLLAMTDLSFTASVTTEEVLSTGQKLQYGGTIQVNAHRPDGLKVVTTSTASEREFYYNGSSLTIVAPRVKYYTTVPAPASIGAMLERAKEKYELELPLADLFTLSADPVFRSRITSGYVLDYETIEGRKCIHYAFRQPNVDWQIWIEEAAAALPCKLVITNTADPSMPQYVAVLHWEDTAPLGSETFSFAPKADMHKIPIIEISEGEGQ